MSEIIVCGHRNPDMDSVCSAYAYAKLKNKIDPANTYTAVRCGHLSDFIRGHFREMGIEPPPFMKDIYPRVGDVALQPRETIQASAPLRDLVDIFNSSHPSVVPVFDGGRFTGLLSVDDITLWFLRENSSDHPVYSFSTRNFARALDGTIVQQGEPESFTGEILAGAMDFESFKERLGSVRSPLLVIGSKSRYLSYAFSCDIPAVVVAGTRSLSVPLGGYKGTVCVTEKEISDAIRLARMSAPVGELIGGQGTPLQKDDLFEDGLEKLAASDLRGLSVWDGKDWAGFVTPRCFLEPPQPKVVMVDHNEIRQGIPGLEKARICEIIDHHRLDARTPSPIFISAEPVGSTCTIVHRLFQRYGLQPSPDTAKVLLSGLLSDTVLLKSPTATFDDYTASEELSDLAGIRDTQEFGRRMYARAKRLSGSDPRLLVEDDFKRYKERGVSVGIGQCEVASFEDLDQMAGTLMRTLEEVRKAYDLDWAILMVTNVLTEESVLLSQGGSLARRLAYEAVGEGVFRAPGVLSRKKQLLPEVIRVIEEA